MFIGFDYGTSNCSVAIMKEGKPTLLPLEGENVYIPSTLCAPTRESVSEHLFRHLNIKPTNSIGDGDFRDNIIYLTTISLYFNVVSCYYFHIN